MNDENRGLSRRSFLTGAAGLSAMAALGLSGCAAPKSAAERAADVAAIKNGNAQASSASGVDWLGSAPEIASADIKETTETDVLVVGAGMSGIMAGGTLAELGAKFMIVEKGAEAAATHYDMGAIHSRWQKEQNLDFDENRWINEHARYASFKNDQSVLRTWIENSGATVEWIADTYTKHFGQESVVEVDVENDNAGGTSYFMPPECHHVSNPGFVNEKGKTEHVKAMEQVIKNDGGEVLYSHDLVKLVQDSDGAVTGAIFKVEGGYKQINAKKGVILACGGYAANADMLNARDPEAVSCITSLNYNTNNTGAGIKAALWAGAAMDGVGATMVFDRGIVKPGQDAGMDDSGNWATNGQFNLGSQPFLKVDRRGERIANESANYDAIPFAAAGHPGGVWCQVFDVNAPADVQIFKTQGCSANTWKSTLKNKTVDEAYQKQLDGGLMMKADTLDELADKLGFEGDDKKTFLATVENYNAMFDAGADTQFGKEAYRLSAIRQAPFYGAWYGGSLLTTIDGVRINKHCQVIDKDRKPIKGLYAVGTCSGSYYAGNYPVYLVGNCLGRQITFGRYAARHAAGDIQ